MASTRLDILTKGDSQYLEIIIESQNAILGAIRFSIFPKFLKSSEFEKWIHFDELNSADERNLSKSYDSNDVKDDDRQELNNGLKTKAYRNLRSDYSTDDSSKEDDDIVNDDFKSGESQNDLLDVEMNRIVKVSTNLKSECKPLDQSLSHRIRGYSITTDQKYTEILINRLKLSTHEKKNISQQLDNIFSDGNIWLSEFIKLIESLPIAISIATASRFVHGFPLIYVNRMFENLTGYKMKDLIGKSCNILQKRKLLDLPEECKLEEDSLAKISYGLRTAQSVKVGITNFRKNGTPFQNLLSLKPIFDDDNDYSYGLAIQYDLADSKEKMGSNLRFMDDLIKVLPDIVTKSAREVIDGLVDDTLRISTSTTVETDDNHNNHESKQTRNVPLATTPRDRFRLINATNSLSNSSLTSVDEEMNELLLPSATDNFDTVAVGSLLPIGEEMYTTNDDDHDELVLV